MPKLEPLKEFICDECGEVIEEPSDGWVEWITNYSDEIDERYEAYNFRIVHHKVASPNPRGTCYYTDLYNDYEGTESSYHLHDFLEDKGLSQALSILRKQAEGDIKFKNKEAFLDCLDLIRRITIPYYEESRIYLDNYYTEYTGEIEIIYSRLNGEELKEFLEWIEKNEYSYEFY